jgi:hypothetical protein
MIFKSLRRLVAGDQAAATIADPLEQLRRLSDGDRGVVLFFAPEAGVGPHFAAHCLVARTLQEQGHRVLIVQCHNVYPRCVVMDSQTLPQKISEQQRQQICNACNAASHDMTMAYGLPTFELGQLVDRDITLKVEELLSRLPEDLSSFEHNGIRFGMFCGAEAATAFKTTDFAGIDPDIRALLILYLRGALLSYFVMQRILRAIKVTRVVHFNEYAMLLAAALAAREVGVPTTTMSMASLRGVDRRRIVLMDDSLAIASFRRRLGVWSKWRDLPLQSATVATIGDDCIYRMSSSSTFVYSPARQGNANRLFADLGLEPDRKLLLAFTSSLDEISANNQYLEALRLEPFPTKQPFVDQIEWLTALVEHVGKSEHLQLVIRIHPREGANHREKISSQHLETLRRHLSNPPPHVKVVWPGANVSSYDLMEIADVGLSAWSSTALEMARLGVPVVVAFDRHTPFPLGDVVAWAPDKAGYFRSLDNALEAPPSLDRVRYTYRWYNLRILGCSMDVGDVVPASDYAGLPRFKLPLAAPAIKQILVDHKDSLEVSYEALREVQSSDSDAAEKAAIAKQLRRCLWYLFTGEDRTEDFTLSYTKAEDEKTQLGRCDATAIDHGTHLELRTGKDAFHRQSPMGLRLASLAATH